MSFAIEILDKKDKVIRKVVLDNDVEVKNFVNTFNVPGEKIGMISNLGIKGATNLEIVEKNELAAMKKKAEEAERLKKELAASRDENEKLKEEKRKKEAPKSSGRVSSFG
ncbi:MAG: hypothetical protein FWD89_01730 [Firmicutes bacterium]|nr:hypothetical protein [Bacillota bacterium]